MWGGVDPGAPPQVIDAKHRARSMARLKRAAEQAKIALSQVRPAPTRDRRR